MFLKYPRLSRKGYIFIYDYITHWLLDVKRALQRYEQDFEINIIKLPIVERWGTLIVTK